MLELIFGTIFSTIIGGFIGLYTRYYFFKITGNKKDIKYLAGEEDSDDSNKGINRILNLLAGLLVVVLIITVCFFIWYCFFFEGWL